MARLSLSLLALLLASPALADDPVFSGPQPGEKLPPFKMTGVFDDLAGKEIDLVGQAKDNPVAIIFVHELTRPSVAVVRAVMKYAGTQTKHRLVGGVVFLADDASAMEERLKRAKRALPTEVRIGISDDGQEGPGAYGLNRKMTLTVLVGKGGKVTANFPLVQPSVEADVPKIVAAIAKATGGKPLSLAELLPERRVVRQPARDPNLRTYLGPIINKTATNEEIDAAVAKLEDYLKEHPAARTQVGDISRTIVRAGKLDSYGTAHAQEYLKKWAKEFVKK